MLRDDFEFDDDDDDDDGPVVRQYDTSLRSDAGRVVNEFDDDPPMPIELDFSDRVGSVRNEKPCGCGKSKSVANAGDYDDDPPLPVKLDFSHRR